MLGYIGCMVGVFVMFLMFVYFYLNMFWRKMKWYWLWIDRLVICVEVGFIILMYFFDLCKMENKVDLCFGIVFFG